MAGKKTRVMYFENKETGVAWIGRATFSKSGKTIYYKDKAFMRSSGRGIMGNYYAYDREIYEKNVNAPLGGKYLGGYQGEYWISGPKKNGEDRHLLENAGIVLIDKDVAEEYWRDIRGRN